MDNPLNSFDSDLHISLTLIMEKLKGLNNRLSSEKNKNPDLVKFDQKIRSIYQLHQDQLNLI
jgi:hypothetical protein